MNTHRKSARKGRVKPVSVITITQPSDNPVSDNGNATATSPKYSSRLTFHQAFGSLCIPMFLAGLVSFAWTVWLIALSFAPNDSANFLMNTAEFDDGTFWLIADSDPVLVAFSMAGWVIVALGYLTVLFKMTIWRNKTFSLNRLKSSVLFSTPSSVPRLEKSLTSRKVLSTWGDVTGYQGRRRKYWNFMLKLIDLTLQTISLLQYLEMGAPTTVVYAYSLAVCVNATAYASTILFHRDFSAFSEVLLDSLFDMFFAVSFPIFVLAYCYNNFQMDRAVFLLNLKVFANGAFERDVRMQANPAQVALFRLSFDSLRILSAKAYILRMSMNMSFCYRFKRVVDVQIATQRAKLSGRAISLDRPTQQRSLPRVLALLLLVFTAFLLIFTYKSVKSTETSCAAYPECVAYEHRWQSSTTPCPCIMLIDFETPEPKTYDDWIHPEDVTDKVGQLATSGNLEVLYLVNRRFITWPEELRRCKTLKHITLVYTEMTTIPDWAKEFHQLEFLHIEGKAGYLNIISAPDDLFESMSSLTFIHFGVHTEWESLPSFRGLKNLKVLVLAVLLKLKELPSFEPLENLERMQIVEMRSLVRIPDMAPLRSLIQFTVAGRGMACCNGFVGECNLTHPFCLVDPVFNLPSATCIHGSAPLASEATTAAFQRFSESVCSLNVPVIEIPTKLRSDICGGALYRECEQPTVDGFLHTGVQGICNNLRMGLLYCTNDPSTVEMRKQQIQLGIGKPCNSSVEAWLGCGK